MRVTSAAMATLRMATAFTGLMAGCMMGCLAQAQEPSPFGEITWVNTDFKPYAFIDGPNKGQGIMDKAISLLEKRVPARYVHTTATNVRVHELMKTQPNVCTGMYLKSAEREKFMEFTSLPAVKILPNGIITTRDRLGTLKPYIDDSGELRLDAALADGRFKLAATAERAYGPHLDGILNNPALQGVVLRTVTSPALDSRLLKLVNQKEFDLLIGYAIELKSAAVRSRLNEEDFAFLPIAGEPALLSIHIGCSKSDAGRQYIAAVDKILSEPAVQQDLGRFYRQWLDAETATRYDRLVKQASASR